MDSTGVAQSGSAGALGASGRRFDSGHPYQKMEDKNEKIFVDHIKYSINIR